MYKLNFGNKYQRPIALVIVAIISILGVKLLTSGYAQTSYGSVYASTGQYTGSAKPGSCTGSGNGECVTFGTSSTTGTSGTTTSSNGLIMGVYAGNPSICTGGSGPSCAAGVSGFESATGVTVSLATAVLPWGAGTGPEAAGSSGCQDDSAYGWAYLTVPGCIDSWLASFEGSKYQMEFDLPMVATNASGADENTLAEGAAGDENATMVTIAQNLVNLGFGNAIIRPGWEFDGDWGIYPWQVNNDTDATNFAAYFKNVVNSMQSVSGAHFEFDWGPTGGQNDSWPIADAYPGANYVNYISEDIYDQSYDASIFPPSGVTNNTSTVAQSQAVWNSYLTQTDGLNWLTQFSKTTGKPIFITEWADVISGSGGSWPNHGLGDDPTFVNNMASWLKANAAGDIYFDYCSVGGCSTTSGDNFAITSGDFPNALAAYKSDFAGSQ